MEDGELWIERAVACYHDSLAQGSDGSVLMRWQPEHQRWGWKT